MKLINATDPIPRKKLIQKICWNRLAKLLKLEDPDVEDESGIGEEDLRNSTMAEIIDLLLSRSIEDDGFSGSLRILL